MQSLQRMCVGTNFSPESEIAVRSAVTLARTTGAHLHLVHVVQRPHLYERVLQRHAVPSEDMLPRALEHLRQSTGGPLFAGLGIDHHVRFGAPFAELIAACRELDCGLLVVGARKRAGLTDLLVGSTAERVLRKATVPVLLAKRALPERPTCILAPT